VTGVIPGHQPRVIDLLESLSMIAPSTPQRTVVHVLRDKLAADPDNGWIIMEGRTFTVSDMDGRSERLADGLESLGVRAGMPVLVMLPNGIEFIDCWLALAKVRAIQVPVNTAYFGVMLEHMLRDSGASHIVVHAGFLDALAAAFAALAPTDRKLETVIVVGGTGAVPRALSGRTIVEYPLLMADQVSGPERPLPAHSEIASIMYTSGTTGASKGVMVTHAHSFQYAAGDNSLQLEKGDVYYAPLPLFHIAGQWAVVYSCLMRGATAVLKPKFSISEFWTDVDGFGVTATFMLGAMGSLLYRTTPGPRPSSLKKVLMTPLIPEYREFCDKFGVQVCTSYASTEVNGVIASDFHPPNGATCGRVRADKFEVRLVDENDEEVPVGTVGELVVRPRFPWIVMAGYWGRPQDTLAAWRNLWLHSGDLLRKDADGYYYFVDRLKDSIRRRGENISSVEVEIAINAIPEILESAVIAVASDLTEQEVLACVAFRPGASIDLGELHRRIAASLPKFMVPRYLWVIDSVPKTPTGKPQKFKLKEGFDISKAWDSQK
jgi:crotonobetaine/carnitine-CoA ligase